MSMEPIDQTNRIYDFVGMEISPEIEEFLKKSTTTQDLESNHRSDQKFMQIYTTSVSFFFQFSLLHLNGKLNLLTLSHLLALINRIWDFSFYLQFLLKEYAWLEFIMHEMVIHFTFKSENSWVEYIELWISKFESRYRKINYLNFKGRRVID